MRRDGETGVGDEGSGEGCELVRGDLSEVLLVEPAAFFEVEASGGAVDVFEGEALGEIEFREDFFFGFRGPTEEGDEVDDGLREEALAWVVADCGTGVAFGHFGAIGIEDEGDVSVEGRGAAESLDELEVFRGVHQVVFAADDVGDFHFQVVDDIDEVEDVGAVGAFDDHVWRVGFIAVVDGDFAADEVVHGDGFAIEFEAPSAVVLVDAVGVDEFLEPTVVDIEAFALEVGAEVAAFLRALVPIEAEPVHAVEDCLFGGFGVTGFVGVFDAEDEGSAEVAGEEPVEQSGASAADVKVASRRRSKASANGHGGYVNRGQAFVQSADASRGKKFGGSVVRWFGAGLMGSQDNETGLAQSPQREGRKRNLKSES